MGDRISIEFVHRHYAKDGTYHDDNSPAFFSHWDGRELLDDVERYLGQLLVERHALANQGLMPLYRLESGTVMVDFIRWLAAEKSGAVTAKPGATPRPYRIDGNYYLGKDQSDGDNSDNGHFIIWLDRYEALTPTEAQLLSINHMSVLRAP